MRLRILAVIVVIALGVMLIYPIDEAPSQAAQPDPSSSELRPESPRPLDVGAQPVTPTPRESLATPSEIETPASVGSVLVELLVDGGSGVEQGEVMLVQEGHSTGPQETVEGGIVEFSNLSPGQYSVRVDSDSLPEGVLAPRAQYRRKRNRLDEIGAPVEVLAGAQSTLTVTLEEAALVYGYLLDPAGLPMEWSHVRFGSMDPKGRRLHTQYVDVEEGGFYQTYVYPGLYCIRLSLTVSPNLPYSFEVQMRDPHPQKGSVTPLPEIRTLVGGTATQIDLHLAAGPANLDGKLIDESGEGFEDLRLTLYPEHVTSSDTGETYRMGLGSSVVGRVSDANGEFHIDGLMPGPYKLQIEPEGFFPLAAPGQSTVAKLMNPIPIRVLAGENTIQVKVPRPSPVRVYGEVKVGPIRNQSPSGARWPTATLVLGPNESRSKDRRSSVYLFKGEQFSFHLEARERAAFLELTLGDLTTVVPLELPLPNSGVRESNQGTILFP